MGSRSRAAVERSAPSGALGRYIVDQCATILAGRASLLAGDDPVHATRVAIRRLRAALRVHSHSLTLSAADVGHLDEELSWYAGEWGALRDLEVQRPLLATLIGHLPLTSAVADAARREIDAVLAGRQAAARRRLDDTFISTRHDALTGTLVQWIDRPPVRADVPEDDLVAAAHSATARAERRTHKAIARGDADLLHRARKSVKRARYANEVAGDTDRRSRRRRLRELTGLQDRLGEFQDSIVTGQLAASLVDMVTAPTAFVLGMVHLRAADHAEHVRHALIT